MNGDCFHEMFVFLDPPLLQVQTAETAAPFVLLGTKLNPPAGARRRVTRQPLVDRLVGAGPRRLTLVSAPPGWGKTTLLAEWADDSREQRPFAWLTLDRADNDPVRFWGYVIEALRTCEPSIGDASLSALGVSGTAPVEVVLPTLINELAGLDRRLVLALEDYHLITSAEIHEGMGFLVERLPSTLEIVIATRLDPPLPLARLRSRGEMVEVRADELRFDVEEAGELLRFTLGEGLSDDDVVRLVARTEGWAAGLYLAALSLSGRDDASSFIHAFAGDDRHIVDYLGGEVLDGLGDETRRFLLRTSILERLSAPLCDHVLGSGDAADRLREIERANLFLVPLDARREWYRYHHLFADLLRHELERLEPGAVQGLHARATGWLGARGEVDEAIRHALAAGDAEAAARLVTAMWRVPFNRGELATVDRWLDDLPETLVRATPDLCLARAWVLMDRGRPLEAERWLAGAESQPEGSVLHAVLCFKLGKLGHAEAIARDAVTTAPVESPLGRPVAHCILGIALYYRGDLPAAEAALLDAARLAAAGENQLARIYALGYLGLVRLEGGDEPGAGSSTREALEHAARPPAAEHFVAAMAHLAHGLLVAETDPLVHAVALARRGAAPLEIAAALLALGEARRDPATLIEARQLLGGCEDPGRLPQLIGDAEVRLKGRRPGPRRRIAGDLSDRELAVLRLLPGDASLREIGASLYLSLNTVKSHSRSIYRKLGVASREEAVARARELRLLEQDPPG
jgi:LuxR family transcriptional regulator, maltose regulon positive regulatory protein